MTGVYLDTHKAQFNSSGMLQAQGKAWDKEYIEDLCFYFCQHFFQFELPETSARQGTGVWAGARGGSRGSGADQGTANYLGYSVLGPPFFFC